MIQHHIDQVKPGERIREYDGEFDTTLIPDVYLPTSPTVKAIEERWANLLRYKGYYAKGSHKLAQLLAIRLLRGIQKRRCRSVVPGWYEESVPLDPSLVSEIQEHLAKVHRKDQRVFAKAPLQYPEEFEVAIDQFAHAVELGVTGNLSEARTLVASIDDAPIVDWFDRIAQNIGKIRVQYVGQDPKRPERRYSVKRKMTVARVRSLAERGGWRCGYCGIRVIEPRVLRKAQKRLGKSVFPSRTTGGSNRDYHGVWLLTALTLDPLLLQALGKYDSHDNLLAAFWGCNFGKYNFTLEQLGLVPPRKRNAIENEWQGLTQWL